MCSPKIMAAVQTETSRRGFLRASSLTTIGAAAAAVRADGESEANVIAEGRFERVFDCSFVLEPNVPNYFRQNMSITPVVTVQQNGVFFNRLELPEQYGTHFDTPAHFIADGITGERILPEQLVGPLVLINIAERAVRDVNSEVTINDIMLWERRNGRIPRGAFVAMYSNWARRWPTAAYLNADANGTYNFPGFGGEAAQFLVQERDIIGIGTDTHSIDVGNSTTFPAHIAVLGAGKIGVEVLAGLGEVLRATERRRGYGDRDGYPIIFVGALRILNGSGSPIRALVMI